MEHVLDNPVWNALISGNQTLAYGNQDVKFFDRDVSPFVGFSETSDHNFNQLYELLPHNLPVLYVSNAEIKIPAPWIVANGMQGWQMVHNQVTESAEPKSVSTSLTLAHVPEMLALTKLTNPGPFGSKTIAFGHYEGIFENGKLAAMAGQRMHPFKYAEISAVCTHPDYLGNGYARQLLHHHINRIRAASHIPFLHVRHDNYRAIDVYERNGFTKRSPVYFYILKKN